MHLLRPIQQKYNRKRAQKFRSTLLFGNQLYIQVLIEVTQGNAEIHNR